MEEKTKGDETLSNFVEFVTKEKWRIQFVPWKLAGTGLAVLFQLNAELSHDDVLVTVGLTIEEAEEFYLDLTTAMLKRFDIEFPNDSKPSRTKEELAKESSNLFEDLQDRVAKKFCYII